MPPAHALPSQIQTSTDSSGDPSTISRNAVGRANGFSSESPRQLSIATFSGSETRLGGSTRALGRLRKMGLPHLKPRLR
jgi:hypothetical protein